MAYPPRGVPGRPGRRHREIRRTSLAQRSLVGSAVHDGSGHRSDVESSGRGGDLPGSPARLRGARRRRNRHGLSGWPSRRRDRGGDHRGRRRRPSAHPRPALSTPGIAAAPPPSEGSHLVAGARSAAGVGPGDPVRAQARTPTSRGLSQRRCTARHRASPAARSTHDRARRRTHGWREPCRPRPRPRPRLQPGPGDHADRAGRAEAQTVTGLQVLLGAIGGTMVAIVITAGRLWLVRHVAEPNGDGRPSHGSRVVRPHREALDRSDPPRWR